MLFKSRLSTIQSVRCHIYHYRDPGSIPGVWICYIRIDTNFTAVTTMCNITKSSEFAEIFK